MQKAVWLVCKRFGLPKDMRLFVSKRAVKYVRAEERGDALCYWAFLFRRECQAAKWGYVHCTLKREVYLWKETDNWMAPIAKIVRGVVMWHYTRAVKQKGEEFSRPLQFYHK